MASWFEQVDGERERICKEIMNQHNKVKDTFILEISNPKETTYFSFKYGRIKDKQYASELTESQCNNEIKKLQRTGAKLKFRMI
jgi:hypothetical protein